MKRKLPAWLAVLTVFLPTLTHAQDSIFDPGEKPKLVLPKGAGEGPAWHPKYGLFFSGGGRITLLAPNGTSRVFRDDAGSNGLLFDHQGRLLTCEPARRRVTRTDMATGRIEVLADTYRGKRFNQPNDITVDSRGRVYFSDPRYGDRNDMELLDSDGRKIEGVYRIDPDGSVTRIITHEVDRPNGLVVTRDDRFLIVADNNNNSVGGARKLWRFELDDGGDIDLSSQKLLLDWESGRGPDGMVLDQKGRMYVAGGRNKPKPPAETSDRFKGGVYVLSPQGDLLTFVHIPHDEVTNCTFGDNDLRTLYITAGGTLWSIRTTTPGRMRGPPPRNCCRIRP